MRKLEEVLDINKIPNLSVSLALHRDVYCATGFDLVNFQCIPDPDYEPGNETSSVQPVVLPSSEVQVELLALVFDNMHESPGDMEDRLVPASLYTLNT